MKIAAVTTNLASNFTQTQTLSIRQSVAVSQATPPSNPPEDSVALSKQGVQSLQSSLLQGDASGLLSMVKAILEKSFGIHIWLWDGQQQPAAPATQPPSPPEVSTQQSVDYQQKQQLQFSANGQVATQDGQQFQFSLSLSMQSRYQYHSSSSSQSGGQPHDPLMITLDGEAGAFSGATVSFDLQNNGQMSALPFPAGGGWLTLDKNGDGKVNNGSELFGPQSGNGFADLAQYDANHDGAIDESDPVYAQLRIWTGRGADGNDQTETLQQAHIGAILLPSVSAPLTIRNDSGSATPTAQMQSAGVYLKDDGQAGLVSQVDVYG
ncbi:hypothetical protein [Chromobacterium alticapitis]|uniref:Haemolysin-type calcium binding-related domain-containing protein n=1 Tax=Chromobacterium alticapitis TaxID=2073169 RepID=A0A2S5DJY0_9NEIS|nr:hypothetical protein [Chromobacterium alticapitis]POZ63405.1 hypothetical protein C2I19_03380 [Chromobacterium alticapitis]